MSVQLLIYLAELSGGLEILFGVACLCAVFVTVVLTIGVMINHDLVPEEQVNAMKNAAIRFAIITFVSGVLSVVIPSARTLYLIAGVNTVEWASTTEEADKVRELLNRKLDDLLEEDEEES